MRKQVLLGIFSIGLLTNLYSQSFSAFSGFSFNGASIITLTDEVAPTYIVTDEYTITVIDINGNLMSVTARYNPVTGKVDIIADPSVLSRVRRIIMTNKRTNTTTSYTYYYVTSL